MVPPDKGINRQVTNIDITIIGAGGGVERMVLPKQQLFDFARLKIVTQTLHSTARYETLTAVLPCD